MGLSTLLYWKERLTLVLLHSKILLRILHARILATLSNMICTLSKELCVNLMHVCNYTKQIL